MVARARDRVRETKDPTAHAVVTALREAARRLGPGALADATVFSHPGALSDVRRGAPRERRRRARLRRAQPDRRRRRHGHPAGPAPRPAAAGCRSSAGSARPRPRSSSPRHRAGRGDPAPISAAGLPTRGSRLGPEPLWYPPRGEVSEWLKVPLSKSGVRKHRGFESHPLRQRSPDRSVPGGRRDHRADGSGRGRLVAYGAALEMRFGATRRGFESPPLRHASDRPRQVLAGPAEPAGRPLL